MLTKIVLALVVTAGTVNALLILRMRRNSLDFQRIILLDRDDPTKVIGSLDTPLLAPTELERDGYVPNVVYSCGALRHENLLLLPFGIADQSVGVAVADLDDVLDQMTPT